MIALVKSIALVNGRNKMIPRFPERPGIAPKIIPIRIPKSIQSSVCIEKTLTNDCVRIEAVISYPPQPAKFNSQRILEDQANTDN